MKNDTHIWISTVIDTLASLQTEYANETETDVQTRTLKLDMLETIAKKLDLEKEYHEGIENIPIILTKHEIEEVIGAIGMGMHEACSTEEIHSYEALKGKIEAQLSNQEQKKVNINENII